MRFMALKSFMKNFKTRSSYQGSQRVHWPIMAERWPRLVFILASYHSISARKRWIVTWPRLPVNRRLHRWVISNFMCMDYAIATGYLAWMRKHFNYPRSENHRNCLLFWTTRNALRSLRHRSYWNTGFCCLWSIQPAYAQGSQPFEDCRYRFGKDDDPYPSE